MKLLLEQSARWDRLLLQTLLERLLQLLDPKNAQNYEFQNTHRDQIWGWTKSVGVFALKNCVSENFLCYT